MPAIAAEMFLVDHPDTGNGINATAATTKPPLIETIRGSGFVLGR